MFLSSIVDLLWRQSSKLADEGSFQRHQLRGFTGLLARCLGKVEHYNFRLRLCCTSRYDYYEYARRDVLDKRVFYIQVSLEISTVYCWTKSPDRYLKCNIFSYGCTSTNFATFSSCMRTIIIALL